MNEPDRPSRGALDEPAWLIWSNEHGAWWRPYEWGYTRVIEEAGRYWSATAEAIVKQANSAIEPGERPNEVAVLSPERAAGMERESVDAGIPRP